MMKIIVNYNPQRTPDTIFCHTGGISATWMKITFQCTSLAVKSAGVVC